jgi:predicted GIY-YIG superfamily endonuclease
LPIDDCGSTFVDLGATILPEYMQEMRLAIQHPRPLSEFCKPGVGVRAIVKLLGKRDDFSGCYVLLKDGQPFYVGISQSVVARLRQHVNGKTHFDASLAYRMACDKISHNVTRAAAMKDPVFRQAFEEAKKLLKDCTVAFVRIENPLELYVFEAYCAMELDTFKWNTFRTH